MGDAWSSIKRTILAAFGIRSNPGIVFVDYLSEVDVAGSHSRNKGAQGERDASELFRSSGYPEAKRGLQQTRDAGEAPDVTGTPWWVEVKRARSVSIPAAMRQAQAVCKRQTPIVVSRDDRDQWLVTMTFADFIEMAKGNK